MNDPALPLILEGQPPDSRHIIRTCHARSKAISDRTMAALQNPAVQRDIVQNCGKDLFFPLRIWGEGISTKYVAMDLQSKLGYPVFPLCDISPSTSCDDWAFYRGCILLVPRHDRWKSMVGPDGTILCQDISVGRLGGWDFFASHAQETGADSPPAALVSSLSAAQFIGMGAMKPQHEGIYDNNANHGFPLPMCVLSDNPSYNFAGVLTEQDLKLTGDTRKPQGLCPDRTEQPFEYGQYLVQSDDWRVTICHEIAKMIDMATNEIPKMPVSRLFFECSPGSWFGGPYRSADVIMEETTQANPHFASALEAEVWARYIRIQGEELKKESFKATVAKPDDLETSAKFVARWEEVAKLTQAWRVKTEVLHGLGGDTLELTFTIMPS